MNQNNKLILKSFSDIRHLLPPPSSMRTILVKIIPTYQGYQEKNTDDCRLVTNFLARMLLESCPNDPFALSSNPYHTTEEVHRMIENIKWTIADGAKARNVGQLITATGSFVHGLYNDMVTDLGWEVYGPYTIQLDNTEHSFLMRHFPNLSPHELWPDEYLPSIKEIIIYAAYQEVEWEISSVGCHTISKKGSPVQGMRKFAVMVDGVYVSLIDWQPTEEMKQRIQGKELLTNIVPHGKMMTDIDEYKELFGINRFAKEVLNEQVESN